MNQSENCLKKKKPPQESSQYYRQTGLQMVSIDKMQPKNKFYYIQIKISGRQVA